MSSLSDLPDDILGLISCLLNGFDNCSLWMASDSKLKQRLVNNVITDFDINYTIPGRYLWPGNFLKKLKRLSRLSVVVAEDVYHLPIENVQLLSIETLKYLKLDCGGLERILEQDQSISSNHSTGPKTPSKYHKYINLDSLYPNLEYFEIGHRFQYRRANLSIELFRSLPKKLTTFILYPYLILDPKLTEEDVDIYIASLPRSLTSLFFHFRDITPSIDPHFLPPNLTRLTTDALIEENSYITIPNTIKDLDFISRYDVRKLSPFLPAGLESLKISSNSVVGASLAKFEHLDCLKIVFPSDDDTDEPESKVFIEKYPPNLKTCHAYFDQYEDEVPKILPFPHGLVELYLFTRTHITRDSVLLCPPTVTDLSLVSRNGSSEEPFEYFELLPKNLRSFTSTAAVVEKISLLPDTLIDLELSFDLPYEMSEDDRFPPKLEKLTLDGIDKIPKSILTALPENLKYLDLTLESIVDDEVIACLPRGLTHLILNTSFNLTDASANKYPPNLEKLHLSIPQSDVINVTDQTIGQLPRSLKYLHLGNISSLTDECIKDMPPRLIHLSLTKCNKITWRCCKDLPKYLSELLLRNCKDWTVDCLKDLPKYLSNFSVGEDKVNFAFNKSVSKN